MNQPHIGQSCVYFVDYRDGMAHPEAAIITGVIGERVSLVHWSASGVQSTHSDVTECREPCPGSWQRLPAVPVDVAELVRAEVARLLDEPEPSEKKGRSK